jgi:hypothetical protein
MLSVPRRIADTYLCLASIISSPICHIRTLYLYLCSFPARPSTCPRHLSDLDIVGALAARAGGRRALRLHQSTRTAGSLRAPARIQPHATRYPRPAPVATF